MDEDFPKTFSQEDNALQLPLRMWWPWDQPCEKVGFEATFILKKPSAGSLHVSASGEYRAWLDGASIPTPKMPYPSWRVMHTISLELVAGQHCLNFESLPGDHGQPFLLACLDWQEDGYRYRLASGADWLMSADPPDDWTGHTGEQAWRPAWAFDGVWSEPWGMACNAPADFCRLTTGWQKMTPNRLDRVVGLYQGQVSMGTSARFEDGGSLEMHPPQPYPAAPPLLENTRPRLEWYRSREAHSMINNNWLDLFEKRVPHAVFDTGDEVFARLVVRVVQGGPAIIALTTGKSLNEVQRYHRRVSDIFKLDNSQAFSTAPTGFRFAKVMVLSSGANSVLLAPLELQSIAYPVIPAGEFSCSDPALNAIWSLSAKTAHRCMQTEIWDGIKRDQLPWMGDLYTEALAIYHAFGDFRLARRSLAILAELGPAPDRPLELRRYPGLQALWKAPGGTPYGPQSGDINGIPAYTLWWIIGLAEYITYSGDTSLAQELDGEIAATLEHVASWVGADGTWQLRGGWDFIDWAPVPESERAVYCHLLACRAIRLGAGLLAYNQRSVELYEQLYRQMAQAARRNWWQDGQKIFGHSHHVNAAAISSGVLSNPEAARLFDRTLAADPPLAMTYWHRFLDLQAAKETGNVQWGLDYLRRHWGPALALGSSTLWEAFDPAWSGEDPHAVSMVGAEFARYGGYETSLCHGWSAGPAAWLHTAVLGVGPAGPGFATVEFRPCLGDLAWAKGAIPTPHGPVQVSLRREQNGSQIAELTSPSQIAITFTEDIKKEWQIHINDR